MPAAKKTINEVELDLGRYELRRFGRRVKLEKKPMELLIFLVRRREQMVSREEIVKKLWRSNLFIDTERNLNNIIRKIRTALGDDSAKPRFLETVVGKGYRFIGPVRVIDAQFSSSNSSQGAARMDSMENAGERSGHSSLAVLPLVLLGKGTDDHGLCLGFADALVARLGNLRDVDVMPTSAVLDLPADVSASEIAARLGIRFVVHGAIQSSKGQWHLSLEMFDAHLQAACLTRKCELDMDRLADIESDIARQIAGALNRPLGPVLVQQRPRYSRDPLAYAEFMRGYRLSATGDPATMEKSIQYLTNAVTRDPGFALAHATLSLACTTRHFEYDPASMWLEKAEFHCRRALEIDPELPEGHVARAFLLWGPSKNFQHLEAIAALKRSLTLQNNLPHAYNRLGTILAHIGLLDHARAMYERGSQFHPRKAVSPSIVQVYVWNQEYDLAHEEIQAWRLDNPGNKYAIYFAPYPALMTGDWDKAKVLLDEALQLLADDPIITSLQGVFYALTGKHDQALDCMNRACASPKSFGHAHHTYYQIACILALGGQRENAFAWLERSVSSGFACWPFFLKDHCLQNLRGLPDFELLVSSLQAKYPDHLGLLGTI
ncbi:MAG TPA: winged helix-turn-helix domain-containing protein [Candidatus Binatia bacterium]|nr:winged helix-turn-helix domain-containing protein [Candidatus Binatia bacterium]